jgi:predicted NUDIX family NTP pyrophosphohydrolase
MKQSVGILLYRLRGSAVEVLIGHMGGPYWQKKHEGAWSIPKGEVEPGEPLLAAAAREFEEELGLPLPQAFVIDLGSVRQGSSKTVTIFASEGDLDVTAIRPGTFEMEWPPRSGRLQTYPELDRAKWVGVNDAAPLLVAAQRPFLTRLTTHLAQQ